MKEREVFIIGGGPSLKGFSFEVLDGLETIAVNEAAKDVPNPTYCVTADSGTYRKLQEGYFKGVDTTWVVVSNPEHASMKFRDGKFKHVKSGFVYNPFTPNMLIRNAGTDGIGFQFKDFRTGYNSGFCAFQLAVLLGYDVIYLLGFDLNKDGDHYHNRYGKRKIPPKVVNQYFNNFVLALGRLKKDTEIEVISCSKESALNAVIDYVPFEKIHQKLIERETEDLSDEESKKLSILICTLYSRKKHLVNLLKVLRPQKTKDVEILIEADNGQMSIGEKRNILLRDAKGDYICYIDDDDMVPSYYVEKILQAISYKPDCCSLKGEVFFKRKNVTKTFIHSVKYNDWFEHRGVYYRCPNHLNVIRRDLALKVGFKNLDKCEDRDYSFRILPLLKKEAQIEGVMYFYRTG